MKVNVKQCGDLVFTGIGDTGHYVVMDTESQYGGTDGASKPKELFLMGLAGCTGMDVASILKKMQVHIDGFEVEVEGKMADTHPKVFTKISLEYRFYGKDIDRSKVERAIELSDTKYCAVSAMIRKAAEIESSYEIYPPELHEAAP